jgi:hypothetical protein
VINISQEARSLKGIRKTMEGRNLVGFLDDGCEVLKREFMTVGKPHSR